MVGVTARHGLSQLAQHPATVHRQMHAVYAGRGESRSPDGPCAREPSSAGNQAADLVPDSQAVTDWQNHDLTADINQLANDGLDVGGPSDATAREKVKADIKQFQSDFTNDEHDAHQVAAGK
jgi:hypothetical protein